MSKRQINPNFKYLLKSFIKQKYHKDKLISGKRGVILEGSSRCFSGQQQIKTSKGAKLIKNIGTGDKVKSFNEATKKNEYKSVTHLHSFVNTKPSLRITLKNGSIIECTEDHKFYHEGAWVSVKHIVSLWNERNMERYS